MKYYCKHCKSVFEPIDDVNLPINPNGEYLVECPVCTDFHNGECNPVYMKPIPDYETPAQYKGRTGKAYPDNGLVWILQTWKKKPTWFFETFKEFKRSNKLFPDDYTAAVIADPPVPPPDSWRPE